MVCGEVEARDDLVADRLLYILLVSLWLPQTLTSPCSIVFPHTLSYFALAPPRDFSACTEVYARSFLGGF